MRSTLIRVEPTPGGHRVHLFVENGGGDWKEESAADLPRLPDAPRREEIRKTVLEQNGASPVFIDIGRELHDLLLANNVGVALVKRLEEDEPTRVLIDAGTDDLRLLPWELIRDAGQTPVFTYANRPFARAAPTIDLKPRDPGLCWPLRVLIVEGTHEAAVEAQRETENVRDAFRRVRGLVDLEVLQRPSLKKLRDTYNNYRPHIFHFVGHGGLDAQGAYLELDPADGEGPVPWRSLIIKPMLAGWKPRVAVLNACQSGDIGENEGALSVAAAFAGLGVGAVIATQGKITGGAAAQFASTLFHQLAKGAPIDQAVSEARLEVVMANPADQREYALATLLLGRLPESVIDLGKGEPCTFLKSPPFSQVRQYVNQTPNRRCLWGHADPQTPSPAVAVIGEQKVGKSALMLWCLGLRALLGDNVAYVNLAEELTLDTSGLLRTIATALETTPTPHAAGNGAAMDTYREEVAPLLEKPDDWTKVFEAFTRALTTAAGDGNLLIALDHFHGVESWSFKQYTREQLLLPIAEGELKRVRIMLALDGSQHSGLLSPELEKKLETVELKPLERAEFKGLALQFMRAHGYRPKDFEDIVELMERKLGASWNAKQFEGLIYNARLFDLKSDDE